MSESGVHDTVWGDGGGSGQARQTISQEPRKLGNQETERVERVRSLPEFDGERTLPQSHSRSSGPRALSFLGSLIPGFLLCPM